MKGFYENAKGSENMVFVFVLLSVIICATFIMVSRLLFVADKIKVLLEQRDERAILHTLHEMLSRVEHAVNVAHERETARFDHLKHNMDAMNKLLLRLLSQIAKDIQNEKEEIHHIEEELKPPYQHQDPHSP